MRTTHNRFDLRILACLAFGVVAGWAAPVAADVKTLHGTVCQPDEFVVAGGTWSPHFNGLEVSAVGGAGALCTLMRDDSLNPMDEVKVGVDPSSTAVTCYVVSVAQGGYLSGYEYSAGRASSGGSPQILTFSGATMTNLDEFDNGNYHVECASTSGFTVMSLWWDET